MQTDMPEVCADFQRIGQQLGATTATSRTSSSRSNAAGCTCFRRGRPSGPRPRPCGSLSTWSRKASSRRRRWRGSSRPTSTSSCALRSTRPRSRAPRRSSTDSTPRPARPLGRPCSTADTAVEWVDRGEKVILVRIETSPDDFHGMAVSQGIITARGGATSHAAVVARQIGKPCVAGSSDLLVDYAGKQAHCSVTGTEFKEE